jgi:hypothetical protein
MPCSGDDSASIDRDPPALPSSDRTEWLEVNTRTTGKDHWHQALIIPEAYPSITNTKSWFCYGGERLRFVHDLVRFV